MTDLTIAVSDELMERLRPHLKDLPRILELGVEQFEKSAPAERTSERERILRLLAEAGIARPLDPSLMPDDVMAQPRQKPLSIPGKPVSEIIIEQRGPR